MRLFISITITVCLLGSFSVSYAGKQADAKLQSQLIQIADKYIETHYFGERALPIVTDGGSQWFVSYRLPDRPDGSGASYVVRIDKRSLKAVDGAYVSYLGFVGEH